MVLPDHLSSQPLYHNDRETTTQIRGKFTSLNLQGIERNESPRVAASVATSAEAILLPDDFSEACSASAVEKLPSGDRSFKLHNEDPWDPGGIMWNPHCQDLEY